ncbi:MAG TPA: hypothetical protein VHV55_07350 [Pirellulales bacterium]|jgi:hypothetical protein|nr:hypothetical protein [Pirellulales bacterium]
MDIPELGKCKEKLRETAAGGDRITYGALGVHLGISAQEVGPYLKEIYHEETQAGRPDITLVVVYAKTGFGRFNTSGSGDTGVAVDPNNLDHVRAYKEQLAKVYEYWLGR